MTREKQIYKVTIVGSIVNMMLLIFKFIAGLLGHSSAMIADAVHSLSDFITDIVVLVFVKISAKPQDKSHDYGHGKFETIASMFIGMALLVVAGGIIISGITKIVAWTEGEILVTPGYLALWAAIISIILKEALFHYTIFKGKKWDSQALIANAWHHRSDALSSIGAAIGIGGAIALGQKWAVLDPVASIIVGIMLIKVAYGLLKNSIGELTEGSLPEETEQEIVDIVQAFNGVVEPHNIRTRRIGNRIAIEMHIRMDGNLSLRQTHDRASIIERRIKQRFGDNTHVTLHVEPIKD